jgi:hypothetical protein
MSKEDQERLIHDANTNPDIARGLATDFAGRVKFGHYNMEPDEIEAAKKTLEPLLSVVRQTPLQQDMGGPVPFGPDPQFQREFFEKRMNIALDRFSELSGYTANILQQTLGTARSAYSRIVLMNTIMFITGISLFIFAALYAAFSQQQKIYSLVFGGLGVANFIALFMRDPIKRTQQALSNLVQVEIAFMNFFEQITIWDAFAQQPPINLASIEKASVSLQQRSREVIEMLETYIEVDPEKGQHDAKKGS